MNILIVLRIYYSRAAHPCLDMDVPSAVRALFVIPIAA